MSENQYQQNNDQLQRLARDTDSGHTPSSQTSPVETVYQKEYYGQQVKDMVQPTPLAHEFHKQKDVQFTQTALRGKYEVLKLIVYVIPIIAIFFLLLKPVPDKDFMWHVRQSLVAQAIWFAVILVLYLLGLPIISTLGLTLWKISGYVILIIAGGMAYSHQRFTIPLAYDIGKNFIEEEDNVKK